ncbi:RNA polymerase I subunit E [Oratosquilla oratoria]|uniref:RNA polymerase I subunit E n=1 Tax=Oratosquilla oratoria TaxID=337810 RepID=UPI003F76EEA9
MTSSNKSTLVKSKKRTYKVADVIVKKKTRAEPVLMTFSNGSLEPGSGLTAKLHTNNSTEFRRRQRQRLATLDTDKLNYFGKNFGIDEVTTVKEQTFIGIYDKDTCKMKLVEMSCFNMKPRIIVPSSKNPVLVNSEQTQTYMEKQEQFAEDFGTKKAKLKMDRVKLSKVNAEEMESAMSQAVKDVTVAEKELDWAKGMKYEDVLPPCNREAEKVEEVYSMDDIVFASELEMLRKKADEVWEAEKLEEGYSDLFKYLLASAKAEEEEWIQTRLVCAALYVEFIIKVFKMQYRKLHAVKLPLDGCPPRLQYKILDSYTEGKDRVKSKVMRDKAVCHILVLLFLVNRFEIDGSVLMQSFPMLEQRKLNTLFKLVGATQSKESSLYKLQLPLSPLITEKIKFRKGKKRY